MATYDPSVGGDDVDIFLISIQSRYLSLISDASLPPSPPTAAGPSFSVPSAGMERTCTAMRSSLISGIPRSPRSCRMTVTVGKGGVEIRALPSHMRIREERLREQGVLTLGEYMVEVGRRRVEEEREVEGRKKWGRSVTWDLVDGGGKGGVGSESGESSSEDEGAQGEGGGSFVSSRSLRTVRVDEETGRWSGRGAAQDKIQLPRAPVLGELVAEIPYEVFGYAGVAMNLMTEATLALEFR